MKIEKYNRTTIKLSEKEVIAAVRAYVVGNCDLEGANIDTDGVIELFQDVNNPDLPTTAVVTINKKQP